MLFGSSEKLNMLRFLFLGLWMRLTFIRGRPPLYMPVGSQVIS
jgi:hypothetical protein